MRETRPSALWPAGGAFAAFFKPPYPAAMAAQFVAVRAGELRNLDPEVVTGIIAFPSYHTILAVLIGLAFAGFPRVFPLVAGFEVAIIFTARSIGRHYYADIVAGIVIAAAANWAATRVTDGMGAASRETPAALGQVACRPGSGLAAGGAIRQVTRLMRGYGPQDRSLSYPRSHDRLEHI